MFTVRNIKNISVSGMSKCLIKQEEITFLQTEEKTTKSISFQVPLNTKKLFITFSYCPKILEDEEKAFKLIRENLVRDAGDDADEYKDYSEFMPLKNLITLSLKSPTAFRGAAHRQAENQFHEIGCDFASYGFLKGEIENGRWQLFLHAHAVVTEKCECKIKVEAEEEA